MLIDLGSFLIYYSVDVCFFCITWQMINSFILGAVIFRLTMAAGIKGNNTRLGGLGELTAELGLPFQRLD